MPLWLRSWFGTGPALAIQIGTFWRVSQSSRVIKIPARFLRLVLHLVDESATRGGLAADSRALSWAPVPADTSRGDPARLPRLLVADGSALACGLYVGDDHLHALLRARGHLGDPGAQHDRARRPGRGELHEPQRLGHLVVVVGVEADLVHIKRLSAVHIGHRDRDELNLPVH